MLRALVLKLRTPIGVVLLLALTVRLWGINYGLPQFFISDERALVYGALKMVELKTVVPAWHDEEFRKVLNYLPVPSYIFLLILVPVLGVHYVFSGLPPLADFQAMLVLDPTVVFLTARIVEALLGVATVWLAYRLTRELFHSEAAAIYTGLFLAFSFYHVQMSQETRHWMPALFFMSIAWLSALRIWQGANWKPYIFGGLAAGLAIGCNTASAAVLISLVLAHVFRRQDSLMSRLRNPKVYFLIGVCLVTAFIFFALYPYGLTQGEIPDGTTGGVLAAKLQLLQSRNFFEWLSFLWYYLKLLFTYETLLGVFAFVGAGLAFWRVRPWLLITTAFILGYLTLLYLFFNIIPRGMVFFLPPLAVLSGLGAGWVTDVFARRLGYFWAAALFSLVFILPSALVVLRYDQLLTRKDTRFIAADWIYKNIPENAKILVDLPHLRLTNTKQGINLLASVDPSGVRVQDRTLLTIDDSRYPVPKREYFNLHFVGRGLPYRTATDKSFFIEKGYRYLIVEYGYPDGRDLEHETQVLRSQATLIMRFSGARAGDSHRSLDISGEIAHGALWQLWAFERFGPFVDVYEL